MSYIYKAFGFMLNFIYSIVENYGVAIILLTILIKIILLPLTLKQQKSMTKTQKLQPKLQEVMEKFKYDKERQSQETMKLYKEYGVNPMGGCLPLLIQFPILIAFYQVIQKPVQYVLGYSGKQLTKLFAEYDISSKAAGAQIELAKALKKLNFDFFGLDLSATPWADVSAMFTKGITVVGLTALIIPALSCITTFLSGKISTMMNGKKKEEKEKEKKAPARVLSPDQKKTANENPGEGMAKGMTYFMPIMTLWLTFTFPAALGLYWTVSNILGLLQNILLNKYYNKKLTAEIMLKDEEKQKKIDEKMKKYNMKKRKRG